MSEYDQDQLIPSDIESALAELRPQQVALERDALLYRAGYAAGVAERSAPVGQLGVWRAATAVATAAAVALAVLLVQGEGANKVAGADVLESAPLADPEADELPPGELLAAVPKEATTVEQSAAARRTADWRRWGEPGDNYLALRAAVLERGIDVWPVGEGLGPSPSDAPPAAAPTVGNLMREWLDAPPLEVKETNVVPSEITENSQEIVL